jgi:hypothetical protein
MIVNIVGTDKDGAGDELSHQIHDLPCLGKSLAGK